MAYQSNTGSEYMWDEYEALLEKLNAYEQEVTVDSMFKYTFTLDRVVDGDTIDITIDLGFSIYKKERIRLAFLNSPETRTKNLEEKALGFRTKEWLSEQLESNNLVVETIKEEKYGRMLGWIFADGVNINEKMIEEGYAWRYGEDKDISALKG